MRLLIQRVLEAKVTVDNCVIGEIGQGFVVLIGIADTDDQAIADKCVQKLIQLRIFADENGKTNRSLQDVGGSLLLVSQFTLYADCRKGNRPSFTQAGHPDQAKALYEYVIDKCRQQIPNVQTGSFGADMKVSLVNDGPFTIWLDSDEICH